MPDQVSSPKVSSPKGMVSARPVSPSVDGAIRWILDHRIQGSGITVHTKSTAASQEVTGYLIPTLYAWGERELARDLASWEARVQRADGAFCSPDGVPYTFDTAQVIRGFLAVLDDMPELERNLRRACEFVIRQISSEGEVRTPSYAAWRVHGAGMFSEYAHLYVLPPLFAAGHRLNEARYVRTALSGLRYYTRRPDLVEFKPSFSTLSHIFGYMIEALVDMGEVELARRGLAQAAAVQQADGAIPAYPGVTWVCSTGMAQLALAWYKLGEVEPADRSLRYLERIQHSSGGWFGSYGAGATYLPDAEISWAPKFFLDSALWKARRED